MKIQMSFMNSHKLRDFLCTQKRQWEIFLLYYLKYRFSLNEFNFSNRKFKKNQANLFEWNILDSQQCSWKRENGWVLLQNVILIISLISWDTEGEWNNNDTTEKENSYFSQMTLAIKITISIIIYDFFYFEEKKTGKIQLKSYNLKKLLTVVFPFLFLFVHSNWKNFSSSALHNH